MRILLVEDDDDVGASLVGALHTLARGNRSSDVVHVGSLLSACAQLESEHFDVCLVDLGLTDASGLDAPRTLARLAPDVPIVVLTGHDSCSDALALAKVGIQDYLLKGECSVHQIQLALEFAVERKHIEHRLRRDAFTDPLTGLMNRRSIGRQLEHAIAQAARTGLRAAVLVVDLDNLKAINDSRGHAIGDLAIRETAQLIQGSVRADDMVGRIGGDEFCVVLENLDAASGAAAVAEKISKIVLAHALVVDGERLPLSVSVGGSVYPDDAATPDALFVLADTAMYSAKRSIDSPFQMHAARSIRGCHA
jgi:diguanylate cyclase (GGDEF)-like protein